jgi:protein-disulfide isomerase
MEAVAAPQGRRRGRWMVRALLVLAVVALIGGVVELSVQEPDRGKVQVSGIGDAQQIFGGVRQDDDRLGSPDAPVSVQVFDDIQCGNCRDQFLATIPTLVEDYVRPGDVKLEYRHYSFSPRIEELGFFGAEAAADQDYAWPYVYLFFHNQAEAERVGIDEDYLVTLAGAIPELDVPAFRDYLEAEGGPGGRISEKLSSFEELGRELGIRARPAAVVSGPAGTETLQDSPTLAEITDAIEAVG